MMDKHLNTEYELNLTIQVLVRCISVHTTRDGIPKNQFFVFRGLKICKSVKTLRLTFSTTSIPFHIYYSETSIHRFRWGSEKETMDPGKQ
jgi:hypothetical protein